MRDVLYFPASPVNGLRVIAFTSQLNDDGGTWIKTCRRHSILSWDHGKFLKTLVHPASNLPQMTVNNGYSVFTSFCNFLEKASVIPRAYKSVFLSGGPINDNNIDPTISTTAPVFPSLSDSVKEQYAIGQSLSLVRCSEPGYNPTDHLSKTESFMTH